MEPEAFRASPCVFAVIADFLGYYWISPDEKVQCRPAGAGGQVEVCGEEDAEETTQAEDAGEGLGAAQVVAAVGGAGLGQGLREGMAQKTAVEGRDVVVEREGGGRAQPGGTVVADKAALLHGEESAGGGGAPRAGREVGAEADGLEEVRLKPEQGECGLVRGAGGEGVEQVAEDAEKLHPE